MANSHVRVVRFVTFIVLVVLSFGMTAVFIILKVETITQAISDLLSVRSDGSTTIHASKGGALIAGDQPYRIDWSTKLTFDPLF